MPHGNSNGNTSWCPGCPGCPYLLALFHHLLDKMIQAKSADVCGLPKSPVISVARNQKLNENESKEPQETTYVSAGDMLTAPWPCQVRTAPSTPSSSSTRAVALAFHGQLPTPSSTLCHTVPHGATLPDRTWHLLHQLPSFLRRPMAVGLGPAPGTFC